jgi:hypothetical protein
MQTNDSPARLGQATACEIIQELYGLGSNYLLREDEEDIFLRLMSKYQRKISGIKEIDPERVRDDEQAVATLIRKALSDRMSDLSPAARRPLRKESLLSAAARASSGIAR